MKSTFIIVSSRDCRFFGVSILSEILDYRVRNDASALHSVNEHEKLKALIIFIEYFIPYLLDVLLLGTYYLTQFVHYFVLLDKV
jgi:hypothetical protein